MYLIVGALPKLDEPLKFALKQKDKDYWDKEHALFGQNDYIGKYLKENSNLKLKQVVSKSFVLLFERQYKRS